MAVSCPEVMYGAYYPYLYGRAGPSRSFYQYERVSSNHSIFFYLLKLQFKKQSEQSTTFNDFYLSADSFIIPL